MPDSQRILIVEDEEGLALHLSFLLKRIRYTPLEPVAYGEEAVEKAAALKPDLVLMDINLAGKMDGIEAARLINQQHNIPVIFLSALADDAVIAEAAGSAPYAYLVKPVNEADLRAAIDIALYKHQMENRLRESEERYRLLFETMTSGFGLAEVIRDDSGEVVDFRLLGINPELARIYGRKPGECDGKTFRELLPDWNTRPLIERLSQVALTGSPDSFEHFAEEAGRYFKITAYSPVRGQFATLSKISPSASWPSSRSRRAKRASASSPRASARSSGCARGAAGSFCTSARRTSASLAAPAPSCMRTRTPSSRTCTPTTCRA